MNRLILHGRMTADPRVKYGEDENHTCFARWTMAVEDRSWKVDDTYHVDFIPCKAIGNVAAVIANTCYKGKELVVSGKMQSGSYEKDGKRESIIRHRETDEDLARAIIKRNGLK